MTFTSNEITFCVRICWQARVCRFMRKSSLKKQLKGGYGHGKKIKNKAEGKEENVL